MYIIQSLKDFGFTKFYMIVVSHFFSDNSRQSLVFSYVPHYAVVQNKRPRASASVLHKIIVTQNSLLFFLKFLINILYKIKVCQTSSIPALCKITCM